MNLTKEGIQEWIGQRKNGRAWLADKCANGMVRTVNNWFTPKGVIPEKALRIIERLMQDEKEREGAAKPALSHLVVRVSVDEFEAWSRAALTQGKIVTDWAVDAIRAAYAAEQAAKQGLDIVEDDQKNGTEG